MADNKYGRIFTEEDVHQIVRHAVEFEFSSEEDLTDFLEGFEGKFPKDEPTFTLRAQDRRAISAIRFYSDHQSPKVSMKHEESIDDTLAEFDRWRKENPDRLKEPD